MLLRLNDIMNDPLGFIISLLLMLPGVCLAISIHESAHGWVAEKCGDPTARYQGRITLNPAKHFDPLGFLCMLFVGFGWARPVPVNPLMFKNYRRDDIKVSLAGITANLCLFLVCAIIIASIFMISFGTIPTYEGDFEYVYDTQNREFKSVLAVASDKALGDRFLLDYGDGNKYLFFLSEGSWEYVDAGEAIAYPSGERIDRDGAKLVALNGNVLWYSTDGIARYFYAFNDDFSGMLYGKVLSVFVRMLVYCMFINMSLAIFNLIPIPPLDGYHVLNDLVLKQDLFAQRRTQQISMTVLMGLILIGHVKPEWDVISIAINWVIETVLGGAGSAVAALCRLVGVI